MKGGGGGGCTHIYEAPSMVTAIVEHTYYSNNAFNVSCTLLSVSRKIKRSSKKGKEEEHDKDVHIPP